MEENQKGFILPTQKGFIMRPSEVTPAKAPDNIKVLDNKGEIQTIKREVNSPNVGLSQHLSMCIYGFRKLMPVYDVALYVISGQMHVIVGDTEKTVGPDTLIYSPSNVTRSLTNVGNDVAKILRMSGSVGGAKMGRPVYSKRPTWI